MIRIGEVADARLGVREVIMKSNVKRDRDRTRTASVDADRPLVGQIVHCHWGATMRFKTFGLILDETKSMVLFARLKTVAREDGHLSGHERPAVSDGLRIARSLIGVTRYATGDALPKSALVARLRIDEDCFAAADVGEADRLERRHGVAARAGVTSVVVFRSRKVGPGEGGAVFRHREMDFRLWDGKDKAYDHND
jgi:hypothetical protein